MGGNGCKLNWEKKEEQNVRDGKKVKKSFKTGRGENSKSMMSTKKNISKTTPIFVKKNTKMLTFHPGKKCQLTKKGGKNELIVGC